MRDDNLLLKDILDAINSILEFSKNMSYEEFSTDDRTLSAVIRKFEVIGEASKKISSSFKSTNLDIPFKEMASMRDRLIHDYFGVDTNLVWKTIQNDLPLLKKQITEAL